MFKRKDFDTVIADDLDHERLFCEIQCDGLFVALFSQERGEAVFDLEIPASDLMEDQVIRKVDLDGFLKAVEIACCRLRGETQ